MMNSLQNNYPRQSCMGEFRFKIYLIQFLQFAFVLILSCFIGFSVTRTFNSLYSSVKSDLAQMTIILFSPYISQNLFIISWLFKTTAQKIVTKKLQQTDPKGLVKNGGVVCKLSQLKHVFIDKTGTMTTGEFEVVEIIVNNRIYQLKDHPELQLQSMAELKSPMTYLQLGKMKQNRPSIFKSMDQENSNSNLNNNNQENIIQLNHIQEEQENNDFDEKEFQEVSIPFHTVLASQKIEQLITKEPSKLNIQEQFQDSISVHTSKQQKPRSLITGEREESLRSFTRKDSLKQQWNQYKSVSYTHLTLPTKRIVQISVGGVS
eukprot:TRINITY_DN7456_c0_g1_i1.p1 TRINITY_DN7456_c0_g1~~TRINITY_DN7456_c0_g1_i1.p1  ORF type:complete len:319 (-),score=37.01 TRINITY_DN7456_c0_g1_i1:97-1053(-)